MDYSSSKKVYPTNSDEYLLHEEIGQGVSAVVYRAVCIPLKETVAIKMLDLETYKHSLVCRALLLIIHLLYLVSVFVVLNLNGLVLTDHNGCIYVIRTLFVKKYKP